MKFSVCMFDGFWKRTGPEIIQFMKDGSNKIFYFLLNAGRVAFFVLSFYGQPDNSALYWDDTLSSHHGLFFLHLKSLHFIKNNEYDSPFAKGDTYFGWQLNPEAGVLLHPGITLEGGFFMPYFFGSGPKWEVYPTLRLRCDYKGMELIAGNLINGLTHRLSEPLYEFEESLLRRQEYGLQCRYRKKRFFGDLWLDWRKKSFFLSPDREHFRAGYSGEYLFPWKEGLSTRLILQALAVHYGGQLSNSSHPSFSDFSGCTGFITEKKIHSFFLGIDSRYGLCYNQSDDFTIDSSPRPYSFLWTNLILRFTHFEWASGYFTSRGYRFALANRWMNTLAHHESRNTFYFEKRNIFFIRASLRLKRYGWGSLLRAELMYDCNLQRWDYSVGLYLNVEKGISLVK